MKYFIMTRDSQFFLLTTSRFAPLFVTQFLGAFHDNLFKNALVVMLLFDSDLHARNPKLLTTLAAGIFILPFIIFSAMGGQLADKFPKEKIIRIIKLAEIGIALFGAASLFSGSILLCFVTLFALGSHSAFFGPSKYAILPQHLKTHELIGGNALVNTGTFLAILFGTIAGTILVTLPGGKALLSALLIGCAVCGYLASSLIPAAPAPAPALKMDFNPFTETAAILRQTFFQSSNVAHCVIGISWFWFLGAMFMAQLPNYTRDTLGANEHVLSLFLVLFSVGIAGGGLMNNCLLRAKLNPLYAPLAIAGITLFSMDLYFVGQRVNAPADHLMDISAFLIAPQNWRVLLDILMIAVCGGLFVVPLNAILQHLSEENLRARILAGSAIMNAALMVASSVIAALLIGGGFNIPQLFLIFALINAPVALYIRKAFPPSQLL